MGLVRHVWRTPGLHLGYRRQIQLFGVAFNGSWLPSGAVRAGPGAPIGRSGKTFSTESDQLIFVITVGKERTRRGLCDSYKSCAGKENNFNPVVAVGGDVAGAGTSKCLFEVGGIGRCR